MLINNESVERDGDNMNEPIIQVEGICKSFSTVKVLENISFSIRPGQVLALIGENGAGKSTLCKIIAGSYTPDQGRIRIGDKWYPNLTIEEAKKLGIKMVHQELLILPKLSIMENIFVGNELVKNGLIDKKQMYIRAKELLGQVGLDADPCTLVKDIDIAARQLVEIARAISTKASLIILDEPTSSLSETEIARLFTIVDKIKKTGVSFIFISHRLQEILELSDVIQVMKDGGLVAELDPQKTTEEEIVRNMVGRNYENYYNRNRQCFGEEILRLENVTGYHREGQIISTYTPQNISFSLNKGEVLGLAGLVGAGRTEVIKLLFGVDRLKTGKVYFEHKEVKIHEPGTAIKMGMAWLTEDRKGSGLILKFSVKSNTAITLLDRLKKGMFIDTKKENSITDDYIGRLNIKTTGRNQKVVYLSGGNQQKVVLAKWLAREPKVLILDEPTRGIDVGAKVEIYKLINDLTAHGMAIILISSELPELIGMSDRVLVMYEGHITGELSRDELSEEAIMRCGTGGRKQI